MQTRVAFLMVGGSQWMGGYNYLLNLLTVIKDDKRIQPVLFLENDLEVDLLEPLKKLGYEIIYDDIFNANKRKKIVSLTIFLGKNVYIEKVFFKNRIDVVFEAAMYLGWRTKIPRLSWIPDFQHRHLPYMFSKLGWIRRDIVFRLIGLNRMIMVSSNDAKKDFINFYGNPSKGICVVPFSVKKPTIDSKYTNEVLKKYNVTKPFFYLPNQIWKHKNHKIIIEALASLKQNKKSILVVSTGKCGDERTATYCSDLKNMIKNHNVENNFKMLGSIPYKDVLHLMNGACAIINPSFFEGWSTTVEEAKTMQKPLILSDIPVHREQVGKDALFFSATSVTELVKILENYECVSNTVKNYDFDSTDALEVYKNNFINAIISTKEREIS